MIEMQRRNCGCRDDSIETKKSLLRTLKSARVSDDGRVIYVGVVFHICFQNYVVTEIESDVAYSIDLLNKDYNNQCSNFGYGKDKYTDASLKQTFESYTSLANTCNIQFYKVDIKYTPIATQTSTNMSVLDTNIKGSSPPISPNQYLNIWIADMNNGLLGYAQFPWENAPNTDGVVIAKGTFGINPLYSEYNLNKTMTHEVGHWFGLYHTFQDTFAYGGGNIDYRDGTTAEEIEEMKGDCVVDTPPQGTPTYGDPTTTPSTWPTSKPVDETNSYRHMFMNYMDYSDDIAMFMFTKDQSSKLRQMIYIYRPDILTNNPSTTVVTTVSTFSSALYDFETVNPVGWIGSLQLINNDSKGTNVQITQTFPHSGIKCLRTRKLGRGELKIDLTDVTSATMTVYVCAQNPKTYIWIKPAGTTTWYSVQIPVNNYYKQYTISLPGPFKTSGTNYYTIRFGTNGSYTNYSYFDDIKITNTSSARKI